MHAIAPESSRWGRDFGRASVDRGIWARSERQPHDRLMPSAHLLTQGGRTPATATIPAFGPGITASVPRTGEAASVRGGST